MAQLTRCTDLFGNDSGGKGQRLVGQEIAIIGSRELQSKVCSQSKRLHRSSATVTLGCRRAQGDKGDTNLPGSRTVSSCCTRSASRASFGTPERLPLGTRSTPMKPDHVYIDDQHIFYPRICVSVTQTNVEE